MSETLNEFNLVQVLDQASNPTKAGSEVQKLAEEKLKSWEILPGYHFLLQSIYLDLSCSLQIRWLAIIQFKNGLDKYWRPTRANPISKEEKALIRDRIFDMIGEQNNQLCIQNAHACARIARIDYPKEWPNLFEYFEKLLSDYQVLQDNVKVYNILIHLNQIVKILSAARIVRCRPAMQAKMPLLFPLIVRVYLTNFNTWTHSNSYDAENSSSIHVSYLALKILRRVIADVFEAPHKDEAVVEFMDISIGHFELLVSNYPTLNMFDIYEKFVKGYEKLYYNLITSSTSSFILLPCCHQVLKKFTTLLIEKAPEVSRENPEVDGDFWEQLSIRSFGILKRLINFIRKKGAISIRGQTNKADIDAAIAKINSQFLTEDLIKKLVDLLIDWYLKLRPAELEHWSTDPEDWMNEQMSTNFEYQIRPCVENFFQDLMNCFPNLLAPYMLTKIETEATTLSSSLDDFLKKDAMFAAFQLSATIVVDMVDFDTLLNQVFLPEALSHDNVTPASRLKVIRRRVCLVINEWSTVKCSSESKSSCYKLFLQLLSGDDDKVVQLSAVQALRTMIDDWDFDKHAFRPYLTDTITLLLRKTLPSVKYTETRLYVLNTLSDIVIQTKGLISNEVLLEILQLTPSLWNLANTDQAQAILANALLRLLRYLFVSLGEYSFNAWNIAIPIIQAACNPNSPQYSLLYEDGYELWGALLQDYSPTKAQLDNRILDLISYLEHGIMNQTEVLPTLLEIVKSYALILSSEQFFSIGTFKVIFTTMSSYLLKLADDSYEIFLSILDILTLTDEERGKVQLINFMFETGVFKTILDATFSEAMLSRYQLCQLLKPVARILPFNPSSFIDLLRSYQASLPTEAENSVTEETQKYLKNKNTPLNDALKVFIETWASCFTLLHDPKEQKIHMLGMASLLKTGNMEILQEFSTMATLWIKMLEEINESIGGDCEKYHESEEPGLELTCERLRYAALVKSNDPVFNISTKSFLGEIMHIIKSELGTQYNEFLSSIDPSILANLELYLSLPSS
ncbi:HHL041Wp [Eremothecium sinecaudum]|uniref:HHL041Wp n=1 Tax=Eremothecium sinecaudum TaxID=45286 RepID=A0A0X8HWD9_9SACH|nr:HHL041Wp [Eremothecium sinecaudum]AMD22729.1 HHL041Wp [Eremothecium sinecaudum]